MEPVQNPPEPDPQPEVETAPLPACFLTWQEEDGWHAKPSPALDDRMTAVGERYDGIFDKGFDSPAAIKAKLDYALAAMVEVFSSAPWRQVETAPED